MEFNSANPVQYELVETNSDDPTLTLFANGVGSVCPFQPLLPIQQENGSWQHHRICCNTGCPLTQIRYRDTVAAEDPKDVGFVATQAAGPVRAVLYLYCGSGKMAKDVTIRPISVIQPVPSIIKP